MTDPYIALQVLMMPKDANPLPSAGWHENARDPLYSSIFGGVILSHIDQAGAIGARREIQLAGGGAAHLVTVAINRVEFKLPVFVGDVVRLLTQVVQRGRTSITMRIRVEAERGAVVQHVTEAEVVYVRIDPATRRPVPLVAEAS